jgi:hypothetical protein
VPFSIHLGKSGEEGRHFTAQEEVWFAGEHRDDILAGWIEEELLA